jgi:hypothetical protein
MNTNHENILHLCIDVANRNADNRYNQPQREAAHLLRCSQRTLERLRVSGAGPTYVKAGRLVRYRDQDLEKWIDRILFDPVPNHLLFLFRGEMATVQVGFEDPSPCLFDCAQPSRWLNE